MSTAIHDLFAALTSSSCHGGVRLEPGHDDCAVRWPRIVCATCGRVLERLAVIPSVAITSRGPGVGGFWAPRVGETIGEWSARMDLYLAPGNEARPGNGLAPWVPDCILDEAPEAWMRRVERIVAIPPVLAVLA